MVINNPIGELLELCAVIRVPYLKSAEKNGLYLLFSITSIIVQNILINYLIFAFIHSAYSTIYIGQLFKCIITFLDKKVESEWFASQKEAEHNAALKILTTLPVRKVDDSLVSFITIII